MELVLRWKRLKQFEFSLATDSEVQWGARGLRSALGSRKSDLKLAVVDFCDIFLGIMVITTTTAIVV